MAPNEQAASDALPEEVRSWIGSAVGPGCEVVRSRRLPGASTSAVHAVDVRRGRDPLLRAVVRRYVFPEVLAHEPDPVEREAAVLAAMERAAVAAPRLLATDPIGASCGVPTLLMTRLPGSPKWRAADLGGFLGGLADQIPLIHAIPVPAGPSFPRYHPYYDDRDPAVPSWTTRSAAWERAIEVRRLGIPEFSPTFIHRDFHPGNVLWRGGEVSGVVDWAWSCVGPAPVDVAHCRVNLALRISCDAADEFLRRCRSIGVADGFDPAWDLIDAVDLLPDLHDSRAALRRLDEFVVRAAAGLGGNSAR